MTNTWYSHVGREGLVWFTVWEDTTAGDHWSHGIHTQEAEREECWCPLSPFHSLWDPRPLGRCCPHSGWVFSLQLTESRNFLHEYAQRFVPMVILSLIKLTKVNITQLKTKLRNRWRWHHQAVKGWTAPAGSYKQVFLFSTFCQGADNTNQPMMVLGFKP